MADITGCHRVVLLPWGMPLAVAVLLYCPAVAVPLAVQFIMIEGSQGWSRDKYSHSAAVGDRDIVQVDATRIGDFILPGDR